MEILTHEEAVFLTAVDGRDHVVALAIRAMELPGESVHVWRQFLTVVAVVHLHIDEPVGHSFGHRVHKE